MIAQRKSVESSTKVTIRPSLAEYFGTMGERFTANRATSIALLAAAAGSLGAMTVMSRFTVPIWLVLPPLFILVTLSVARHVFYALFVRVSVIDGRIIERSGAFTRQRIVVDRLDLVRYRVRYGSGFSGKKCYFAMTPGIGCQFYLPAIAWKEEDMERIAAVLNGSVRGTWNNVIDVDLVGPTIGGPCRAW